MQELPNIEGAARYALRRLERELLPGFCYHSIVHTRDDVVPAVEKLAALQGVEGEELLLLRTAAYYHDLGFVEQRAAHEAVGVQIAERVLPYFGYGPAQIEVISGLIMATRLPQSPRTPLERLLADADLDILGREDFLPRNKALRDELAGFGQLFSDQQWYRDQLRFVQTHNYWTQAAHALRDEQKLRNCEKLNDLLASVSQ